jgi:hypothetical protein
MRIITNVWGLLNIRKQIIKWSSRLLRKNMQIYTCRI